MWIPCRVGRLPLLQKNYKFTKVFFWGKLTGTDGDYLIAMGIEESYTAKKFFYWCVCTRAAHAASAPLASPRCWSAHPLWLAHRHAECQLLGGGVVDAGARARCLQ